LRTAGNPANAGLYIKTRMESAFRRPPAEKYDGLLSARACGSPKLDMSAGERGHVTSYQEHVRYRPDIDGLRAIAITTVLMSHALPEVIPGGFIGVDIFFVISGFLISSIIFSHVENGDFSYVGFYAKRIKRIFPALSIVLAATLFIGFIVLSPVELKTLGVMTFASSVFSGNLEQIRVSGYFDTISEYKPLLHLWSLGIEEQFYLVYPIIVVLMWRRMGLITILILVFLSSFLLSAYLSYSGGMTGRWVDNVLAYYFPFSRLWELMIGGFLAFIRMHHPSLLRWRPDIQSITGLSLIVIGLIVTSAAVPFPGTVALLPALGAFLLISAGSQAVVNKWVLSSRMMVWIGLISYPLYLWHWPLLSFVSIMEGGMRTTAQSMIAVVLAVVLAWMTFVFVENPIRFRIHSRRVPIALCVVLFSIGSAGLAMKLMGGLPSRAVVQLNAMDNVVADASPLLKPGCRGLLPSYIAEIADCQIDKRGKPVFAVLGDSKASALFPALVKASTDHGRWMIIGGNGSFGAPIPIISNDKAYEKFQPLTLAAVETVTNNHDIKVVVLITAIREMFQVDNMLTDMPNNNLELESATDGLQAVVHRIVSSGKKIIIVTDNPPHADPIGCMHRLTRFSILNLMFIHKPNPNCEIDKTVFNHRARKYFTLLTTVMNRYNRSVLIYDTRPFLCSVKGTSCPSEMNGHMLYSYGDHLSAYGAGMIAGDLVLTAERFAGLQ
jgi:peptidoglycan/LPS O-acetylase OafA/YrhL